MREFARYAGAALLHIHIEGATIESAAPSEEKIIQIVSLPYALCAPCSNANVMVDWSHTSLGPKYWIGPG